MITLPTNLHVSGTETPQNVKLRRAAIEFETLLLASWLGQLRQAYSIDTGQETLAGGDSMISLATQAVAGVMADQGGIGIARLMYERLRLADPSPSADL